MVICGAGNIYTCVRARRAKGTAAIRWNSFSCSIRVESKFHARVCISYPPQISIAKIRDYSLSSIWQRLFIFTDREHSAKNRQKVKTAVEVSGVSERELKIDIMYPLSNHNHFRRVVRSSWILTVRLRPSYKNIALFVLCFLVTFLRLLDSKRNRYFRIEEKHNCACNMGNRKLRFYLFRKQPEIAGFRATHLQ